jgi:hypothetical protein
MGERGSVTRCPAFGRRSHSEDSPTDCAADSESTPSRRPIRAGGLVWFSTSHPLRVREVENQTEQWEE